MLEDVFTKKIGPWLTCMPRKPLAKEPPTAPRIVGGLPWAEGKVLRLAAGKNCKDFFFRFLKWEIGETQSGAVGENRLDAQTADVGLFKFGKCFFHRERGEAGIEG